MVPGVSLRFTTLDHRLFSLTPPASANTPTLAGRWAKSGGTFSRMFFASVEKAAGHRRSPKRFAKDHGGLRRVGGRFRLAARTE